MREVWKSNYTQYVNTWVGPALFLAVIAIVLGIWWDRQAVTIYGIVAFGVLAVKVLLALVNHRIPDEPPSGLKVVALVPVYNEDPGAFSDTIAALLDQSYKLYKIVVVDDHSESTECYERALWWQGVAPDRVVVHRQPENLGKRHAMAWGVRQVPDADIYLGVDSDTLPERPAVYNLLRPFRDSSVMASTGNVVARNADRSLLTRLIDLRYNSAFLVERGAYSQLGAVLCVCGSLAAYRGWVFRKHLDDFVNQTFRGKPQVFGDDRHLTNLCLQYGKVVLVRDAHAGTVVPQRFQHYARQQIRWGKSFFRESLWALRNLDRDLWAWWLTLFELVRWAIFIGMVPFVAITGLLIDPRIYLIYIVWIILASYAHSVLYPTVEVYGRSTFDRWLGFVIAPLYGVLVVVILVPLRLWSLITLGSGTWGTRNHVEVILEGKS